MNLHAIVLGATGATGRELVKYLIKNPKLTKISIFSRKEIGIDDEKLIKHIIDFSCLENYKNIIKGDILFSALGTTLKDAGSKENQFLVDYTYQYKFAKIAAENGVSLKGSTIYVIGLPICHDCAKGLIQAGISRVVTPEQEIPENWQESISSSISMFKEAGVVWDWIKY